MSLWKEKEHFFLNIHKDETVCPIDKYINI